MNTDGYILLPNFADSDSLRAKIEPYKSRAEYIFNGPSVNDHKRKQVALPANIVSDLRQKIEGLSFVSEDHRVQDFVLLRSLSGCTRQMAHTDYIPTDELLGCPTNKLPYLFLFAVEDNTSLIVWPSSHRIVRGRGRTTSPYKLYLSAGDAVLFRPDLVHAGSEYENENVRIHCYIDSSHVRRDPNRTWIIRKHADDLVQSKVVE